MKYFLCLMGLLSLASAGYGDDPAITPTAAIPPALTLILKKTDKPAITTEAGPRANNELWIKNLRTKEGKLLVASKADPDMKRSIANIQDPQFSADWGKVYFLCSAWAESGAIHVVDLKTGKEKYVCPGNSLRLVQSGEWAGNLIVMKHKTPNAAPKGSYDHYYVVDPGGKEVKDLGVGHKGIYQLYQ